ncbi:MAG: hypothetical protein ACR2GY_04050, partial [Phycisphaerales bacterium]
AEEFTRVELFYDAATLLPAGIRAFKGNGDIDTAIFLKPQRNAGVDPALLDTSIPTEPGWRVDVREWGE